MVEEKLARLADRIERVADAVDRLEGKVDDVAGGVADLSAAVNANVRIQDREAVLVRGDMNDLRRGISELNITMNHALAALPGELADELTPRPREVTGSFPLAPPEKAEQVALAVFGVPVTKHMIITIVTAAAAALGWLWHAWEKWGPHVGK